MATRFGRPAAQTRTIGAPGPALRRTGPLAPSATVSRRGVLGAGTSGLLLGSTLALPALTLPAPPAWAGTRATAVRLGAHEVKTRVVLDLSDAPAFRVFSLTEPARLVIDLKDADWLVPAGALPGPTGHVAGVRHGLLEGGVTRIVLDLATPVRVLEAFALSPRDGQDWRLVVDVTETPARAFATTAGHENAILGGQWGGSMTLGAPVAAPTTPPADPAPDLRVAEAAPSPEDRAAAPSVPLPRRRPTRPGPVVETAAAAPIPAPPSLPEAGPLTPAAFIPVPARKPPAPRKPMIALDPGHGGRDPGAISVGGLYEKTITLAMAKELRAALVATGRYRVMLTRDRDVSVRLRERVRRARQAGADLFLSIHADSLANPKVRGLSVYTLSEKASDAEAGALAERENKADIILGMDFSHESRDVTNILIDLAQRETMNRSVQFANALLTELPEEVRTLNHSRRFAGFAVLKAPDVPSALLEMGYLSNHTDEKLLRQRAYRAKLATAVIRSLDRFFTVTQGARLP
ncbi:N-acetylmuramoyl-L-alanine amidase [Roseospira navarrensis]|uniref:N-acetylmuramoyl-L-alanine amidase n=1 Tax=Roseospira navarrensis TaxID=140058 RepID=A0A7X1ZGU3_9PROT|nr:N-acetylmuramoyl-L-alanine amidase [Roseospira navarrensis]MQX38112.1 AMIN domain-containing protein [Roseospira navarrensis]